MRAGPALPANGARGDGPPSRVPRFEFFTFVVIALSLYPLCSDQEFPYLPFFLLFALGMHFIDEVAMAFFPLSQSLTVPVVFAVHSGYNVLVSICDNQ